jgi:hypothetical protein
VGRGLLWWSEAEVCRHSAADFAGTRMELLMLRCCGSESAWLGVEDSRAWSCTGRFRLRNTPDGHGADRNSDGIQDNWSRAGKTIREVDD